MGSPPTDIEGENREFTEQYRSNFEVRVYLDGSHINFKKNRAHAPYAFYRKGKLDLQFEIFKEGQIKGKRLLEIGSGPTIDFVIIPSHYFEEIYLSDFNQPATDEINLWRKGSPHAFDWSDHFKYICELEGNGFTWKERQDMLRSKVKDVFQCDVLKKNPLDPVKMEDFDCILTSNCLNTASTTIKDYNDTVANVVGLLKPGGHFISFIGLGNSSYKVGSFRFQSLPIDEETFKNAAVQCGLKVLFCKTVHVDKLTTDCVKLADLNAYMILHAVKQ